MTDQPNTQPENNNQPENKGDIQPRDTTNNTGYTPRHETRSRIKHPTPPWWPTTYAAQLALGHRVADAINSIIDELNYDIPNNLVANIQSHVKGLDEFEAWLANTKARVMRLTDDRDFLYHAPSFVGEPHQLIIPKLDPNTVATLGPVDNSREYYSGLLGLLIDLEEILKKSPAYNASQDYGIQLGFITPPKQKPDPATTVFQIKGFALVSGHLTLKWNTLREYADGAVIEYREINEPDVHWHPAGTIVNNPGYLSIPRLPTTRDVELAGRYFKYHQQLGEWSQPYRVTIPATEGHNSEDHSS